MRLVDRFERAPGACLACGNDALPAVDLEIEPPPALVGAIHMSAYLCRICCGEIGRLLGLEPPKDTSEVEKRNAELERWNEHLRELVDARDHLLEKSLDLIPKKKADEARRRASRVSERNGRDAVIREIHELAGTVPPIRDDVKQIEAFKKNAKTPEGEPLEVG